MAPRKKAARKQTPPIVQVGPPPVLPSEAVNISEPYRIEIQGCRLVVVEGCTNVDVSENGQMISIWGHR